MRFRADAGAATLAAVAISLVIAVGVAVAGALARGVLAQHRAEAVAELAALSAAGAIASFAADPCDAAVRTARANGAELAGCAVTYRPTGPEVDVRVAGRGPVWPIGAVHGSARAGLRPLGGTTAAPPEASPP